jgi:rare lipoprotein A (peptidoglycan hydrolase)
VAHRTLPCGTRLELYYAGRRLVVPVIDRGPYVVGITWDLTTGAARALGFPGQGRVGTIAVGRGRVPAR